MTDYVFAYGSLLNPTSVARTLPRSHSSEAVGAQLPGFVRAFNVAFPNDGSEGDKAYLDPDGARPSHVLFANLVRTSAAPAVNGVLLPLRAGDLALLVRRERRYELLDVTTSVRPLSSMTQQPGGVWAFIGTARYTASTEVARGVVSREYVATIHAGVHHWNRRYPGFARDYHASTRQPPDTRITDLTRIDAAVGTAEARVTDAADNPLSRSWRTALR